MKLRNAIFWNFRRLDNLAFLVVCITLLTRKSHAAIKSINHPPSEDRSLSLFEKLSYLFNLKDIPFTRHVWHKTRNEKVPYTSASQDTQNDRQYQNGEKYFKTRSFWRSRRNYLIKNPEYSQVRLNHVMSNKSESTNQEFNRNQLLRKQQCDGRKNLMDDLGLLSLIIAVFSTFVGFGLDLVLTFISNGFSIVSTILSLLLSIPNSLITLFMKSSPAIYWISNALNVGGFIATFIGIPSIDVGNIGLVVDILFTLLGIVGLVATIFGTYPETLDWLVEVGAFFGRGRQVEFFLDNYGCYPEVLLAISD